MMPKKPFNLPRLSTLLVPFFLSIVTVLQAQTNVTTNAGDESVGSLGWAVTTINNAGGGSISIDNSIGPITLTQPFVPLSQTVTFLGVSNVIGQDSAQAQYLFQHNLLIANGAAMTLTDNGALASGLDAGLTAVDWTVGFNSSFTLTGGNGPAQTAGGGAFVTLSTGGAWNGSNFLIQGGAGGVGNVGGDGGSASVSASSLFLSGTNGKIGGGAGGGGAFQSGNGGDATLNTGSLQMVSAAQLQILGGSGGVSTGALGSGGEALLYASSVSLTGANTYLTLQGGLGESLFASIGSGPDGAGAGGSVAVTATTVLVDSLSQLSLIGGAGGAGYSLSTELGGNGGSATVLAGSLALTNQGSMSVSAGSGGAGGLGNPGGTGGTAFVTVGSTQEGGGTLLSISGGGGGGNANGGSANFIANSQSLSSGATFLITGGGGGSGAGAGGNGGAVQVTAAALTLATGSLWEAFGGAAGTGTSTNGSGGGVQANITDLEGSGTVSMGGQGSLSLQVNQGDFTGTLAGGESLSLVGYGALTLTGNNTYSGGTSIAQGRIAINSDAGLGSGNLTLDGGTLEVDAPSSGPDVYNTTRSIVLTGNGGTIDVSTGLFDSLFSGVISGPGGLDLTGGSLITLEAVNTYSGPTTITDGQLLIASFAQILGPVTVMNLGTLSGEGSVLGSVSNNGTIQGGAFASYGTLTVGSYTQDSAGTLASFVSPTQSDLLSVSGGATLDGNLEVQQNGGAGTWGVRYKYILLSAGSLTGSFAATLYNTYPDWTPTLSYGSNAVTLTLTRDNADFVPWATGANETSLANVLNAAVSTGSDSLADKLNELYLLPSGQGKALDQMVGPLYAALPTILLDNAQFEDAILFNRLNGASGPSLPGARAGWGQSLFAAQATGNAARGTGTSPEGGEGLWLYNTNGRGSVSAGDDGIAYTKANYGILIGYDAELFKGFTGGLMAGYLHTDVNAGDLDATGAVDGTQFGAYGGQRFGDLGIGFTASYQMNNYRVDRSIVFVTDANNTKGEYSGSQYQAALQADLALKLGGLTVRPLAGAQYAHLSEDGFTETGSDSLALKLPAQSYDSVRPYLGVDAGQSFAMDEDLNLHPRLNFSVSEELMTQPAKIQAALIGAPNNAFTLTGTTPSAATVGVGAGLGMVFSKKFELYADYQGQFSGSQNLNDFDFGADLHF